MIIEDFKDVTGYDLQPLVAGGISFLTQKYPIFRNSLVNGVDSSKYFRDIEDWLTEYDRFQLKVSSYAINLEYSEYWEMVSKIDELWSFMKVCSKLEKFLRVIDLGRGITRDRVLRQNQDLENLGNETGNEWEDLAIDNGMNEEDYTPEGGNVLKTPLRFYFGSENIESCVVSPVGEEIYGRDISKDFRLVSSDIEILDNRATLLQTCEILLGLVKGAIPGRRYMGIGNQDFVGNSVGFSYPVLLRQISESLRTDDSFSSIGLAALERGADGVMMNFSIETRLGEMINFQKQL